MAKPSVACVGCGTVGTAMGRLLARAGYPITGVSTRHEDTAKKAAEQVGAKRYATSPGKITVGAQVVFVTTPDDAIASTCRAIAENSGFDQGAVVIHCSGALSSSILSPARSCNASVASLHPLQSFASVEQAEEAVPGSFCTIEGDAQALPIVRQLVHDLGGRLLEITEEGKTLYHAAAVVASNYLVTLMHAALSLNHAAGLTPDVAFKALLPLIEGTMANIEEKGIPKALTGPIARGDIATVTAHLEAIHKSTPELLDIYHALGRLTIGLALDKGTLSTDLGDRFLALFNTGKSGHGC